MEIDNKTPIYETVMKKFCFDFPSDENKQHGYSVPSSLKVRTKNNVIDRQRSQTAEFDG